MAKKPEAGQTKTRLSPPLRPTDAADLAQAFLLDALAIARSVAGTTVAVAVWPAQATDYFEEVAPGTLQVIQVGQDLSERLAHVMTKISELGYETVIATNADGPNLPAAFVEQAFELLEGGACDVALGPAEDGGYYQIGWTDPSPQVITKVQMSTATVLDDTLAVANKLGLKMALTDCWYDVDTPADLDRLCADLQQTESNAPNTRRALAQLGLLPDSAA